MPGDNFRKKEIPQPPSSEKENSWSPHDAGRSPQGDSFRVNPKTLALGAGGVAFGLLGRAEAAPGAGAYLAQSTEAVNSKYGRGAGYEASIHPVLRSSENALEERAATNSLSDKQTLLSALTTPEASTPSKTLPDTVTVTRTVTRAEYVTFTQRVANDGSSDEFSSKSFGLGALAAAAGLLLGVVGAGTVSLIRQRPQQPRNRIRDSGDAQTEHGGSLAIELRHQRRTDNQDRRDAQTGHGGSSETLGPGPVDQEADYRAQGL